VNEFNLPTFPFYYFCNQLIRGHLVQIKITLKTRTSIVDRRRNVECHDFQRLLFSFGEKVATFDKFNVCNKRTDGRNMFATVMQIEEFIIQQTDVTNCRSVSISKRVCYISMMKGSGYCLPNCQLTIDAQSIMYGARNGRHKNTRRAEQSRAGPGP